ncbi:MAG: hypothetical protein GWN00_29465 [Aliifodinibius sp.]|nr:sulfotransferase domain-containing protein [Fodinibius sp.]NIV14908.1 hypothetical protein [Fodinibius sp.]NIY28767.1 hypothetical protein [Fodinibius sp.]
MSIAQQVFDAKWIANGFPKAGTHLLSMMLQPIAPPTPSTESGFLAAPWAGTHADNSWTGDRMPLEWTCFKAGRVANAHQIKAHLAYDEDIDRFLYLLGANHIMIYRDLRDVAVSQAFHILNSRVKTLLHPDRGRYMKLGSFDAILLAVIEGLDEFLGIIERWENFAPWLDVDWVLPVKYEDLLDDPYFWADKIFKYGMKRQVSLYSYKGEGLKLSFDKVGTAAVIDAMAKFAVQKEKSPTYRKGVSGEWKERFYPVHIDAFKKADKNRWLVKLGYERDEWYE